MMVPRLRAVAAATAVIAAVAAWMLPAGLLVAAPAAYAAEPAYPATPATPAPPAAAAPVPRVAPPPAAAGAKGSPRAGASGAARSAHPGGPSLSAGEVKAAQRRLLDLGYWAAATAGGPWDASWRQVLVAFQKVEWRKPTGVLTRDAWNQLLRAEPPAPKEAGPAHIEVDLARQVLFLVDDAGVASHILPISSGSGRPFHAPGWGQATADTPCGHFTVFSRSSGWHKSQLGEMYNPLYLVGGIAIHGSLDVPPKPVSHGCIRIPMYAARRLPRLVPREMPVVVYGCADEVPPAGAVAAKQ
jgi:lipoprotein-anchoring transpeptidase ErfK/SrfK